MPQPRFFHFCLVSQFWDGRDNQSAQIKPPTYGFTISEMNFSHTRMYPEWDSNLGRDRCWPCRPLSHQTLTMRSGVPGRVCFQLSIPLYVHIPTFPSRKWFFFRCFLPPHALIELLLVF